MFYKCREIVGVANYVCVMKVNKSCWCEEGSSKYSRGGVAL